MSGRYLALEGIEGAGKSTVAARLVDLISAEGHSVVTVREPGGTAAGERIRSILLTEDAYVAPWTEALLFAAARAQLAAEVVGPALADGSWVISDRSVYSSLAYQGGGRGLGIGTVRSLNEPGLNGVWPELVVLLRLDASIGLSRQEDPDRIGAEGVEFQARVAVAFDEISSREPDRFIVVDAALPFDDVLADVWREVKSRWLI